MMILDRSDIEKLRSPKALYEFVIAIKNNVSADDNERYLGILKKGLYKEFLDEIVPLSCFAQIEYQENCRILPVLGNQGFDAKVFDESGREIDRIEITSPNDGAENAEDARLIVKRKYGSIHMDNPVDNFDKLFTHVLNTCRHKAMKDYSDCTLVVAIELDPSYPEFEEHYEAQIAALVSKIKMIKFNAKRVILIILPGRIIKVHG